MELAQPGQQTKNGRNVQGNGARTTEQDPQKLQRLRRHRVRHETIALDNAGISEGNFLARVLAVDQSNRKAQPLQMQCRRYADDTGAEHHHVKGLHLPVFCCHACSGPCRISGVQGPDPLRGESACHNSRSKDNLR